MYRVPITRCSTFTSDNPTIGVVMPLDNAVWTLPEINKAISHAASRLESVVLSDMLKPRLDDASRRGAVYAELVEPIAQWLFSLAIAGGADCVMDLTDTPSKIYEVTYANCGPRIKVFMPNRFSIQVSNPLVSPGNVWGPCGKFGLRGILLEVGSDRNGPLAELTLMLSSWTDEPETKQHREIALIGFSTRGLVHASCLRGTMHGTGFEAPVERDMTVKYMLGIERHDDFACDGVSGGTIDDRLGFPFAEEVLLGKMPLLIEYLRGCVHGLAGLTD